MMYLVCFCNKRIYSLVDSSHGGFEIHSALLRRQQNGTDIPHRRDKKLQQELVKGAGLRSVRQAGGANFSDVEEFLRTETFWSNRLSRPVRMVSSCVIVLRRPKSTLIFS